MMRICTGSLLAAAILGGLCHGAAMASDLSVLGHWLEKYPFDKAAGGKPLWAQSGVRKAMRAAMGKHFFALSKKEMHGPEGPVAGDGNGLFAAWSCKAHDCGDNQMTVFFESAKGSVQVCWRDSTKEGGKVRDLWLADGKARPLPVNACLYAEKDPFQAFRKFGSVK